MALAVGTSLGPYQVLAALGAGGMGEVYRARDVKLGREIALKTLPESFTHDPERLARFRREAQILAALNHPHIAAIHGIDEADGVQFLVLELVDGETLEQRITRGVTSVEEGLRIAEEIADALDSCSTRRLRTSRRRGRACGHGSRPSPSSRLRSRSSSVRLHLMIAG